MASSSPDAGASGKPAASASKPREPMRTRALSLSDLPRRFGGHYVLLRRIAKGGMGEVMLASTLGLEGAERPVIIKTIRAEHRTDKSFNARFLDEARVQAQLEHPGVAQIVEATTDDDTGEPYVVVEHVDGKSLGDVRARALTTGQRVDWHEAVSIAHLTAEALAHVHERADAQGRPLAIVHRDLSPQNVMVSYGGETKVIDFGTARGENRRCHTVSGVVFAKPGYVAPEVANNDPGDSRVDLYALGVMLWELCAGRRFLQGEASDHMAAVAKNERNLPPIAEIAGAPAALDEVILKLTAFNRDDRYARTKLAARDLANVLGAAPGMDGGERGVRGRVAGLMARLFDGESARARREFVRLIGEARKLFGTARTPHLPTPQAAHVMKDEREGILPGTRFRTVREIARGAGTIVLEAEHVDLGRRVAIKIGDAVGAHSSLSENRLRREARVLSGLSMPGVVRVLDMGKTLDQRPFVVLELCAGETLEARVGRDSGMPWLEALDITDRLLEILERVHARHVIHRDIKPSNVVVDESGAVTLLDFGIALSKDALDMSDLDTPKPSRPNMALYGTPEYMAPEQAARPAEADERSDIYAVGAMLYEMLTGRLPFIGESPVAILEMKAQGSPEAPSERAPSRGLPADVDALCLRALARHASLRFGSASEMRAALRLSRLAPARARRKRRKLGFAVLGSSMAAAAILFGALASRYSGDIAAVFDASAKPEAPIAAERWAPDVSPSVEPLAVLPPVLTEAPATMPSEPPAGVVSDPEPTSPLAVGDAPRDTAVAQSPDTGPSPPEYTAEAPRPTKLKKAKKSDTASKKKPRKRQGKQNAKKPSNKSSDE